MGPSVGELVAKFEVGKVLEAEFMNKGSGCPPCVASIRGTKKLAAPSDSRTKYEKEIVQPHGKTVVMDTIIEASTLVSTVSQLKATLERF